MKKQGGKRKRPGTKSKKTEGCMRGWREGRERDKSSGVERWQARSWMQPLRAWWLNATKMSTTPRCSQCSHSAQVGLKNTAARTSREEIQCACVCAHAHASTSYATALFLQAPQNKSCLRAAVEKYSVPSCLALRGPWFNYRQQWESCTESAKEQLISFHRVPSVQVSKEK